MVFHQGVLLVTIRRWALLSMLVLAAGLYWLAAIPQRAYPLGSVSLERYQPGLDRVRVEDFGAVDQSRPTAANGSFPGSATRELKGAIWRPSKPAQPGPLLVYSHGFMSFHQEGEYLAYFLASHGYTVVAVDYPLTNYFAPGKPLLSDVSSQPGDIHFLIDTLLKRSADPNDVLYGSIDDQRIAVAGVSLGGLTSTLAAFHRGLRDPRIKAAVSIAGPAYMLTPDFFAGSAVPYMMIAGDTDAIVPYAVNAQLIPVKDPGSVLVTLHQASHTGFAAPAATYLRFFGNPDEVGCDALKRSFENRKPDHFMAALAGADVGIEDRPTVLPCSYGMPERAMPAARQHMLTTLATWAFLDGHFNRDAGARAAAQHYLLGALAAENPSEVSVQSGLN